MEKMKMVFVSVPMSGKDEALIKRSVQIAKRAYLRHAGLKAKDVEFYDNFSGVKDLERENNVSIEEADAILHKSVCYLGLAIQAISACDVAVFGTGWKEAKGCCIEHTVCELYGVPIDDLETRKRVKIEK